MEDDRKEGRKEGRKEERTINEGRKRRKGTHTHIFMYIY